MRSSTRLYLPARPLFKTSSCFGRLVYYFYWFPKYVIRKHTSRNLQNNMPRICSGNRECRTGAIMIGSVFSERTAVVSPALRVAGCVGANILSSLFPLARVQYCKAFQSISQELDESLQLHHAVLYNLQFVFTCPCY